MGWSYAKKRLTRKMKKTICYLAIAMLTVFATVAGNAADQAEFELPSANEMEIAFKQQNFQPDVYLDRITVVNTRQALNRDSLKTFNEFLVRYHALCLQYRQQSYYISPDNRIWLLYRYNYPEISRPGGIFSNDLAEFAGRKLTAANKAVAPALDEGFNKLSKAFNQLLEPEENKKKAADVKTTQPQPVRLSQQQQPFR